MKLTLRYRIAFWLERWKFLHPWLFKFHTTVPSGKRLYVNRINGHLVVREEDKE